jgi:hypothetical protein
LTKSIFINGLTIFVNLKLSFGLLQCAREGAGRFFRAAVSHGH